MSDLDKRITEALNDENRVILETLGEQNVFGQLGGLFTGKMGWIFMITAITGVALFALVIYASFQALQTDDIPTMLRWGAVAFFGFMGLMMIKIWSWIRMESNRMVREMKRIELQLAQLLITK